MPENNDPLENFSDILNEIETPQNALTPSSDAPTLSDVSSLTEAGHDESF